MEAVLATLIGGAINGGLYALLGIALVLIFSTTSVANFAQGEMAMLSCFVLIMFIMPLGVDPAVGWMMTLAFAAMAGGLIYFSIIRPNQSADHLNITVRTLGLTMLIHAVAVYLWGANGPYRVPSLFGSGQTTILGAHVSWDQIGVLVVASAMAALFFLFFRFTTLGLAMRAVAINPEVASLQGVNVRRVTVAIWVIASSIGAVVGLLIAPISFLEPELMQPYLLKAFTAAIMGGMKSFPGVIVGGLILGIAEAFAAAMTSIHMREPFVFVILLLVLLARPSGLFGTADQRRV